MHLCGLATPALDLIDLFLGTNLRARYHADDVVLYVVEDVAEHLEGFAPVTPARDSSTRSVAAGVYVVHHREPFLPVDVKLLA